MRSELIFSATTYVSNRYLLVMLASKATRKLHRPTTRIEDTANDAFARLARAQPRADVRRTGNLQPFPGVTCVAKTETASLRTVLDRSVA
jgi:hypothetical protein